jgi:hypothetical protein
MSCLKDDVEDKYIKRGHLQTESLGIVEILI